MGWYSAMIIYETTIEGPPDPSPAREESIRVFRADSDALARMKAEEIGRQNEHAYKNDQGEMVVWKFVEVLEVQDLYEEELADGVEVFSRMKRG